MKILDARNAPRGPKIDQHHFAFVVFDLGVKLFGGHDTKYDFLSLGFGRRLRKRRFLGLNQEESPEQQRTHDQSSIPFVKHRSILS